MKLDLTELAAIARARARADIAAMPLSILRPFALLEDGAWTLWVWQGDQLLMVVERSADGQRLEGVHVGSDEALRLIHGIVGVDRLIPWLEAMAGGAKDGAAALSLVMEESCGAA